MKTVKRLLMPFLLVAFSALLGAADTGGAVELRRKSDGERSFLTVVAAQGDEEYRLWEDDRLSSGWLLSIAGKVYSPGEDSAWTRKEEETARGRSLTFSNSDYSIEQVLVISAQKRHAAVFATITNNARSGVSIAPALLIDTSIGEPTGVPFQLSDGSAVVNETERIRGDVPRWIRSEQDRISPALTAIFYGQVASTPERVVLANWLNLREGSHGYKVQKKEKFNRRPYSENDSAMLLIYEEQRVEPGKSIELAVVFGVDEFSPPAADFQVRKDVWEQALRERLRSVERDIDSIDALLDSEGRIDADSVAETENRVNNQEKLRAEYESL